MSPHPCTDCFLFERRGVCLAAKQAYGLETPAEVQRRAEALRMAIAEDMHADRGLFELIRREAHSDRTAERLIPAAAFCSLGSGEALTNESSKEAINVLSSGPN